MEKNWNPEVISEGFFVLYFGVSFQNLHWNLHGLKKVPKPDVLGSIRYSTWTVIYKLRGIFFGEIHVFFFELWPFQDFFFGMDSWF